jgi:hypothetical protein
MELVQAFESSRIPLLGEPNRLGFRYFPSFGSSRSGHATRRDASLTAMRHPFWKLYSLFPAPQPSGSPKNFVAEKSRQARFG